MAALVDAGFDTYRLIDPLIIGDISENGRINASDASRVARFAALFPIPEIPPIPGALILAQASGVSDSTAGSGSPPRLWRSARSGLRTVRRG